MTYRIAEAPRFAGQRNWDCCRCDHEQLRRPVFLEGPTGVFAAGTCCAAIMLGLVPDTATSEESRKALKAHTDNLRSNEERDRRARTTAENALWPAWLADHRPLCVDQLCGIPNKIEEDEHVDPAAQPEVDAAHRGDTPGGHTGHPPVEDDDGGEDW